MSNVAAMQVVAPVVLVVAVLAAAAASSAAAPGADQCLPLVSPSVPMTWPLPTPSQVANLSVAWAPATEAEVAALSVGARCDLVQHLVGPDPAAWAAPFDPDVPAILTNVTDNRAFAALCRKDALLTRVRRPQVATV